MRKLFLLLALAVFAQGQGRELAPREFGPTPYRPETPNIAYGDGRFLTVWREDKFAYGTHMVGAFSDANARPIGPPFTLFNGPEPIEAVVATAGAFYVFTDDVNALEMMQFDLSGRETGPRRRIPIIPFAQTRVAWNGRHFLAVASSNVATGDANGVLFTREGEVVRRNIALSNMTSAEIVPAGDDFVVLITNRNGLFADRVDETGAVSRTMVEEAFGFDANGWRVFGVTGAAREDGSVVALWTGFDWRGHQLKAAVIAPDGTPGETQVIATGREQFTPLFVIRGASGLLAGYTERQYDFGEPYQRLTVARLDDNAARTANVAAMRLTQNPPVAAAGDGVAGLAYLPPNNVRPQVLHRVVDANASISAESVVSIARARHLQPVLGAGGGQFLAAFTEIGAEVRALTAPVAADGEPVGHQPIAANLAVSGNELAWSGTEYLALLQNDEKLFGQRLTFDGDPIGEPVLIGPAALNETQPSVAWSVDRWVVVWLGDQELYFATVSPSGIVSPRLTLALNTPRQAGTERRFLAASVAADGARMLISWIEAAVPSVAMPPFVYTPFTYSQRFRRNGQPIDPAPVQVAKDAFFLSTAAGEGTLAVVANAQAQTTLTLLSSNNSAVLATQTLPPGLSDVAWDGDEYILATRLFPSWPLESAVLPRSLSLSRFDAETLRETRPTRGIATLPSDVPAQPSVAAVAGEAVIAIQEGHPDDGARAVVYRERDMTAPWPPPKRRVVRR